MVKSTTMCMHRGPRTDLREIVGYAGAFMACLTGSGFATGQEILQYFAAYGLKGFFVSATMLALFSVIGSCFVLAGKRENFVRSSEIFRYYCGPHVGAFYDGFTTLFVFLSYVVMIAGAGAALQQQFGVPSVLASLCMMALVCATTLLGFGNIMKIFGKIGPAIAGLSVLVGVLSFFSNPTGLIEHAEQISSGAITVNRVGTGWLSSTCSYVGFCLLWLASFLTNMGRNTDHVKACVYGVVAGSTGFTVSCTAMMLGLLAWLPEIAGAEIPALILASRLSPALALILSIAIFFGIYTAAVPLLWQASSRFASEGSGKYQGTTITFAIFGAGIALLFPFSVLVNAIYGVSGYIGFFLGFFVIKKELTRFFQR